MANLKFNTIEAEDEVRPDRVFTVEDHEFERRDPYGFWYCKDPIHPLLEGAFTHETEVHKAVHKYNEAINAAVKAAQAEAEQKALRERQAKALADRVAKKLKEDEKAA